MPDVIVSAGGATLGLNVALSRVWQVPNVFCGSIRGYSPEDFLVLLSPYPSAAVASNVVVGPKPTPLDPDTLPRPRSIRSSEDLRGARIGVLVGGPTPYAMFDEDDWEQLARVLEDLTSQGCRITVATSPRTPDAAYAQLARIVSRGDESVSFIDYRSSGPGSIAPALGCDVVLVTSDSMSMVTEAAVAQRPALALRPRDVRPYRDDEAVDGLVAEGWLAMLPLAECNADRLLRSVSALKPMTENHLDRLADRIVPLIRV